MSASGSKLNLAAPAHEPDVVASFRIGFSRPQEERLPAAGSLQQGCSVVLCTLSRPESVRRFLASLLTQTRLPDELFVVDASSDDRTEGVVREFASGNAVKRVAYDRVTGRYKGLTRQRNFALARIGFDLVAFFDDDTVLGSDCISELERAQRSAPEVVGAGGFIEGEKAQERLWRLRRSLGIVGNLTPGRYSRSGMSIPWSLLAPTDRSVEGDWLPGCAMMWKTRPAREESFHEGFAGYAQGEDLDFSLRMRRRGRLVLVGSARLKHLQEPEGRPDAFRLGYMAIRNRYEIQRRGLPDRTSRDVAWFAYAWTADTLMLARHVMHPVRWGATLRQIGGRIRAAIELGFRR